MFMATASSAHPCSSSLGNVEKVSDLDAGALFSGDCLFIGRYSALGALLLVVCLFRFRTLLSSFLLIILTLTTPFGVIIGGAGRFFECPASVTSTTLSSQIFNLGDNTRLFCGHEYTVENLKFAAWVEPENKDIENKLKWASMRESEGYVCPFICVLVVSLCWLCYCV